MVGSLVGWLVSELLESFVVIQGFFGLKPFWLHYSCSHVIVWRHEMLTKMQSPNASMIFWMPFLMFASTFVDLLGDLFSQFLGSRDKKTTRNKNTFCERSLSVFGALDPR